ncbi:MAG: succinate dehydrogenase cytochrome b subunit [Planctomycetaceae bacterium]|nr:succinate dehydrogenase cytochrome b subunit [Planctomycetaceae bacterium]
MNWVVETLNSSVGKKLIMACTGLLLCLFLVVHLMGNFLMFVGPDAYNAYAHGLHSQEWFVRIAETGLLILFAIHIWLALETNRENREARSQQYAVKKSKIANRRIPESISPENNMLLTGVLVLAFMLLHLGDFTLNMTMPEKIAGLEPFDKAFVIMRSPVSAISYLLGVILLGWHLSHGVTSLFQTFGLRHPKYDPLTRNAGPAFAVVIAIGFASFPLFALISSYETAEPTSHEQEETEEAEQHSRIVKPVDTDFLVAFDDLSAAKSFKENRESVKPLAAC